VVAIGGSAALRMSLVPLGHARLEFMRGCSEAPPPNKVGHQRSMSSPHGLPSLFFPASTFNQCRRRYPRGAEGVARRSLTCSVPNILGWWVARAPWRRRNDRITDQVIGGAGSPCRNEVLAGNETVLPHSANVLTVPIRCREMADCLHGVDRALVKSYPNTTAPFPSIPLNACGCWATCRRRASVKGEERPHTRAVKKNCLFRNNRGKRATTNRQETNKNTPRRGKHAFLPWP